MHSVSYTIPPREMVYDTGFLEAQSDRMRKPVSHTFFLRKKMSDTKGRSYAACSSSSPLPRMTAARKSSPQRVTSCSAAIIAMRAVR